MAEHIVIRIIIMHQNSAKKKDPSVTIFEHCKTGAIDNIKELITADPNLIYIKNDSGETLLCAAVQYQQEEIVKYLLEKNCSIGLTNDHQEISGGATKVLTPLMRAASLGNVSILNLLIERALLIDQDKAPQQRKNLLEETDNSGMTALYYAIIGNQVHATKALLKAGADFSHIKDIHGKNMLEVASSTGSTELVNLLKKYFNPVLELTNDEFEEYFSKNTLAINRLKNSEQDSLLIQSCASADSEKALWLLSQPSINISEKNPNSHWDALMTASYHGGTEIVSELLKKEGISCSNQNNYGSTALILAAFKGHTEIAKMLLDHDLSQLDKKNNFGISPLMAATLSGNTELMKLLLSKKDLSTIYQKSPMEFVMLHLVALLASLFYQNPQLFNTLSSKIDAKTTDSAEPIILSNANASAKINKKSPGTPKS
jgi:ankyrin repeat protein